MEQDTIGCSTLPKEKKEELQRTISAKVMRYEDYIIENALLGHLSEKERSGINKGIEAIRLLGDTTYTQFLLTVHATSKLEALTQKDFVLSLSRLGEELAGTLFSTMRNTGNVDALTDRRIFSDVSVSFLKKLGPEPASGYFDSVARTGNFDALTDRRILTMDIIGMIGGSGKVASEFFYAVGLTGNVRALSKRNFLQSVMALTLEKRAGLFSAIWTLENTSVPTSSAFLRTLASARIASSEDVWNEAARACLQERDGLQRILLVKTGENEHNRALMLMAQSLVKAGYMVEIINENDGASIAQRAIEGGMRSIVFSTDDAYKNVVNSTSSYLINDWHSNIHIVAGGHLSYQTQAHLQRSGVKICATVPDAIKFITASEAPKQVVRYGNVEKGLAGASELKYAPGKAAQLTANYRMQHGNIENGAIGIGRTAMNLIANAYAIKAPGAEAKAYSFEGARAGPAMTQEARSAQFRTYLMAAYESYKDSSRLQIAAERMGIKDVLYLAPAKLTKSVAGKTSQEYVITSLLGNSAMRMEMLIPDASKNTSAPIMRSHVEAPYGKAELAQFSSSGKNDVQHTFAPQRDLEYAAPEYAGIHSSVLNYESARIAKPGAFSISAHHSQGWLERIAGASSLQDASRQPRNLLTCALTSYSEFLQPDRIAPSYVAYLTSLSDSQRSKRGNTPLLSAGTPSHGVSNSSTADKQSKRLRVKREKKSGMSMLFLLIKGLIGRVLGAIRSMRKARNERRILNLLLKSGNFEKALGKEAERFGLKLRIGAEGSYYDVLGLEHGADRAQIKRAYLSLVKKHHPDVSKEIDAGEIIKRINEAYATLGDTGLKSAYDKKLTGSTAEKEAEVSNRMMEELVKHYVKARDDDFRKFKSKVSVPLERESIMAAIKDFCDWKWSFEKAQDEAFRNILRYGKSIKKLYATNSRLLRSKAYANSVAKLKTNEKMLKELLERYADLEKVMGNVIKKVKREVRIQEWKIFEEIHSSIS